MKIADKIKQIRKESGKSQQEMSDILGLPRYIIANWEQGRSAPALEDIAKISECFNCSTDYLLGREDDTSNNAFFPEYIETKKGKFGNILRQFRKERGLTQEELAEKMGLKYYNIGDWERGKCEPCVSDLKQLAEIFDVTVDYLVGRTDEFGATFLGQTAQSTNVATMGATLSEKETELLQAFNALGIFEQDSILVQIKALAEKKQAIKK